MARHPDTSNMGPRRAYIARLLDTVRDYARAPYAWPGGYQKVLYMADGGTLCHKCARSEYQQISRAARARFHNDGWKPEGVDIYWEGPTLYCDHCNAAIPSAYGDPDKQEQTT